MALFEMRRMAAALGRIASRDPLTGLANRRRVEQAVRRRSPEPSAAWARPSVVVVGPRRLQEVNDRWATPPGTPCCAPSRTGSRRTARTVDTVARLGGDEFVVLLEHTGGPGAVAALGRLRAACSEDWPAATVGPPVGASLGDGDLPAR